MPLPPQGRGFVDALVAAVIKAVDEGQIPRAQYGAVLIDEGHDFAPQWLTLVAQMVDPEINSLLLLYDDAQSLYAKKGAAKFSFKRLGIQAQGRTTILRVNYRNTNEILQCAYDLASDVMSPEEADDDGVPLVSPKAAGRRGPAPELFWADSPVGEARHIAAWFTKLHDGGVTWRCYIRPTSSASRLPVCLPVPAYQSIACNRARATTRRTVTGSRS